MKKFYVCSYGGSGSKMLCSSLSKYGESVHIHSRKPPNKLEYVGTEKGGAVYHEWFNGISIPEDELHNYYVIYIYRNPSFSIPSRFCIPEHLNNIQTKNVSLDEVIKSGKDLYKLREFHNNYIKKNKNRNYQICCVKYEDIFDKQDNLSELLKVGKLNMVNKSKRKNSNKDLNKIYSDLIKEMEENEFITIS